MYVLSSEKNIVTFRGNYVISLRFYRLTGIVDSGRVSIGPVLEFIERGQSFYNSLSAVIVILIIIVIVASQVAIAVTQKTGL